MKITIHAGSYKTATSGIQVFLHKNRSHLLKTKKILYPVTGSRRNFGSQNEDSVAHNLLMHAVRPENDVSEDGKKRRNLVSIRKRLEDEVTSSGAAAVVLSAETLSLTSQSKKARFLELFSNFPSAEIHVVYAVRNYADFAESMANQSLKNPMKRSEIQGKHPNGSGMLRDLQNWAELVDPKNIHALYFDPSDHVGFCGEFLTAIGYDTASAEELAATSDNMSVSTKSLQSVAVFADLIKKSGVEVDTSERWGVLEAMTGLELSWKTREKVIVLSKAQAIDCNDLFLSQQDQISSFLTLASNKRMTKDLKRREHWAPKEPNIDSSTHFSQEDLAELILATHRVPELKAIVEKYIANAEAVAETVAAAEADKAKDLRRKRRRMRKKVQAKKSGEKSAEAGDKSAEKAAKA